jgi:hypothetical protein
MPHGGLAWQYDCHILEATGFVLFYEAAHAWIGWWIPFFWHLESNIGSGVMGICVFVCMQFNWGTPYGCRSLIPSFVAAMVYGGVLYVLKVDEMKSLLHALIRRIVKRKYNHTEE